CTLSRRELIATLASATTLPLLGPIASAFALENQAAGDAPALMLLESIAENLLRLFPESATSLGIDNGARAALRSQLTDRSLAGQKRIAGQLKADLARLDTLDTGGLSPSL